MILSREPAIAFKEFVNTSLTGDAPIDFFAPSACPICSVSEDGCNVSVDNAPSGCVSPNLNLLFLSSGVKYLPDGSVPMTRALKASSNTVPFFRFSAFILFFVAFIFGFFLGLVAFLATGVFFLGFFFAFGFVFVFVPPTDSSVSSPRISPNKSSIPSFA